MGKKPSINTSTCNCRNKEGCPLYGQCKIVEVVYKSARSSNQPNYKEKIILLYWNCGRIFQRTSIQQQFIFQKWTL